jgi:hypothetical protein
MFSSLEKRTEVFRSVLTESIAKELHERIKDNAKSANAGYADDVSLSNTAEGKYVIHALEYSKEIGKVNRAAFYYKPVNDILKGSPAFMVLSAFSPYHKSLLPLKPGKDFSIYYRSISDVEYETLFSQEKVDDFISSLLPKIRTALKQANIASDRLLEPNSIDSSLIVEEDLGFTTIRKEFGIQEDKVPVWHPVVEEFRKGEITKEAYKKARDVLDLSKTIPDFRTSIPSESENIIKGNEKFQEKLLKR